MSGHEPSSTAEPAPIVIYDKPLLLHPHFVFRNADILPGNSALIIDQRLLQMADQVTGTFPGNPPEALSISFARGSDDQMMDMFYKHSLPDQPEFVDVNQLTLAETPGARPLDANDDVVFVKEYQRQAETQKKNGLRRNPMRKARNTKGVTHLLNEHLLEEDFGFLDRLDEEDMVVSKSKPIPAKEPLKNWPVNVFERPEYNPHTKEVEPLDYMIRSIGNKQLTKKPKLEVATKAKTKPKKKYVARKRKPKSKKPVEKVAAKELSQVVGKTMQMIKELMKGPFRCPKGLNLVKNQTALMALVNNQTKKQVADSLRCRKS